MNSQDIEDFLKHYSEAYTFSATDALGNFAKKQLVDKPAAFAKKQIKKGASALTQKFLYDKNLAIESQDPQGAYDIIQKTYDTLRKLTSQQIPSGLPERKAKKVTAILQKIQKNIESLPPDRLERMQKEKPIEDMLDIYMKAAKIFSSPEMRALFIKTNKPDLEYLHDVVALMKPVKEVFLNRDKRYSYSKKDSGTRRGAAGTRGSRSRDAGKTQSADPQVASNLAQQLLQSQDTETLKEILVALQRQKKDAYDIIQKRLGGGDPPPDEA